MQISQQVRVRGTRWRITDIRVYENCQLVTLAGAAPRQQVVERQVLAPFDDIEPLARSRRARFVRSNSWRRACRTLIAENTPPGSLQSAHRARINVMAHQLEPALAVVHGLGTRVLLADEVGLGKTIEAGIIVCELRTRGVADRVLVLAPAGLRDQWVQELSVRFGLEAHRVDAPALRVRSAALPVSVNPWAVERIAVASIDYVKRPEVLPALLASPWDVVIVDEAHGAAGDSERQSAVHAIASRASYVLLLTATPHSGDVRSFTSLCSAGAAGTEDLLVFRRRRSDVRGGAVRKIHALHVRSSPPELRLHALLERYVAAVRAEQGHAWLAASVLHKRALSSAWSLARSVERRLEALSASEAGHSEQLGLPFFDADGEFSAADHAPAWPATLGLRDRVRECRMLDRLLEAARSASASESKLAALVRLLRRVNEPAIVFTEYRDTLLHMRSVLRRPAAMLHGGLTQTERAAALADFAGGRQSILLATDAGGEGLNLHRTCRLVINLELPWNPMRLEQRIGRVDRIGQDRTVHAFHLIAGGTAEIRILARLKERLARASADFGAPDPVGIEEERSIAHLALLGTPDAGATAAGRAVPCVTPDLQEDAAREVRRLTFSRLLIRDPAIAHAPNDATNLADQVRRDDGMTGAHFVSEADRPRIHRARRARLRAALGRRALMVWRIACEDGCGRTVASTLVPLIVDLKRLPRRWTRQSVDHLCEQVGAGCVADTQVRPCVETNKIVDAVIADWRAAAARSVRAFVAARSLRERAIQALTALPLPQPAAFQQGLFDRRADRARQAAATVHREGFTDRQQRLVALELAATISTRPAELLLVLLP